MVTSVWLSNGYHLVNYYRLSNGYLLDIIFMLSIGYPLHNCLIWYSYLMDN
jgi:hypothetical protein